jgi:hypothetical protein
MTFFTSERSVLPMKSHRNFNQPDDREGFTKSVCSGKRRLRNARRFVRFNPDAGLSVVS